MTSSEHPGEQFEPHSESPEGQSGEWPEKQDGEPSGRPGKSPKRERTPHDAIYQAAFGHPRTVRDLLKGFAEKTAEDLDLPTLEPVNSSWANKWLKMRHADSVWRLRRKDGRWFYVFILLEFQSTVRTRMAKRMLDYRLQMMHAHDAEEGTLPYPPVLPVVIYNGETRWWAKTEVADLFGKVPAGLLSYLPRHRYLLIPLRSLGPGELPSGNAVSLVAKLEQYWSGGSGQRLAELADEARELLGRDEPELLKFFGRWIKREVMVRGVVEGEKSEALEALARIKENDMSGLGDGIARWRDELLERGAQRGLAEGVERGLAQGVEQGQRDMASRMAARKFGAEGAERLAPVLADISDADRMASIVHECETVDELIERAANGS